MRYSDRLTQQVPTTQLPQDLESKFTGTVKEIKVVLDSYFGFSNLDLATDALRWLALNNPTIRTATKCTVGKARLRSYRLGRIPRTAGNSHQKFQPALEYFLAG